MEFREFRETGYISPARMRVVDANAQALGVSAVQLMESAGKGLADYVRGMSPGQVVVLCGKGNNGGDGFVAARHLCRDCVVTVIVLSRDIRTENAARNYRALSHCGGVGHHRRYPPGCRSSMPGPDLCSGCRHRCDAGHRYHGSTPGAIRHLRQSRAGCGCPGRGRGYPDPRPACLCCLFLSPCKSRRPRGNRDRHSR